MKMRKSLKVLLSLALSLVLLAGCGSGSSTDTTGGTGGHGSGGSQSQGSQSTGSGSSGGGESLELRFALDQSPDDTWTKAAKKFAELLEQKTDGQITISVYDSGTLGAQRQALEGILGDTIHGTVTLEPLSYWVEEIGLYGVPYLFRDQDHLDKFLESEHGKELEQLMIDKGFRALTVFKRPPRHVTSNKPVNSLDDLKGLKIRLPETPTGPAAFKAMGANPVALPFSEVYSALDTGVIDAQENPLPTIYANKFHEVQKYLALTAHQYQVAYFVMSEKVYATLSDELKQAVMEAALETQQYEAELLAEDMKVIEDEMRKAGVTFTEPDREEFANAARNAYEEYDPLIKEWIEKIQSLQ